MKGTEKLDSGDSIWAGSIPAANNQQQIESSRQALRRQPHVAKHLGKTALTGSHLLALRAHE